jgi:photosystem II stability/assembly factor-like uncharacterized protein
MYDVDFVDQDTAFACGYGEVRKTADGGRTWVSEPIPLAGNFVGIDFVTASTGWVVGAEGSIYKTTDGGSTWVRQRHDTSKFYTGVSFVADTEGWVSSNSTILHTVDAGATWTGQPIPSGADAIEVRFVDSQNGWAAGALRTILHTTVPLEFFNVMPRALQTCSMFRSRTLTTAGQSVESNYIPRMVERLG